MNRYSDINIAPGPQFVEELEQLLLRELGHGGPDGERPTALALAFEEPRSRRRQTSVVWWAAAFVVVMGTWAVARDGIDRAEPVAPPTVTMQSTTTAAPMPSTSQLTTAADETTTGAFPTRGELPPARYEVTSFAVPFSFATTTTWTRDLLTPTVVNLYQTTGGPEVAVTAGLFPGSPLETVAAVCAGAADLGAPEPTTLLGAAAVRVTGSVTTPCTVQYSPTLARTLGTGVTLELTAADVDGTVVVVVAAAVSPRWEVTVDEVRALVASLRPLQSLQPVQSVQSVQSIVPIVDPRETP